MAWPLVTEKFGMKTIFTNLADLSRLGTPAPEVNMIKQGAYIKVDENGTEAAAVTTVGGGATAGRAPFTFAYISGTHLYEKKLNDRFVRAILRAVDDVNRLDPQPDFVLFGGDLAQLGQKA